MNVGFLRGATGRYWPPAYAARKNFGAQFEQYYGRSDQFVGNETGKSAAMLKPQTHYETIYAYLFDTPKNPPDPP